MLSFRFTPFELVHPPWLADLCLCQIWGFFSNYGFNFFFSYALFVFPFHYSSDINLRFLLCSPTDPWRSVVLLFHPHSIFSLLFRCVIFIVLASCSLISVSFICYILPSCSPIKFSLLHILIIKCYVLLYLLFLSWDSIFFTCFKHAYHCSLNHFYDGYLKIFVT